MEKSHARERAKFNLYRYQTALEMNNFTTLRKFCGPQRISDHRIEINHDNGIHVLNHPDK